MSVRFTSPNHSNIPVEKICSRSEVNSRFQINVDKCGIFIGSLEFLPGDDAPPTPDIIVIFQII